MRTSEPKKILLIEDDPDQALLVRMLLEEDFRDCDRCILKDAGACSGASEPQDEWSPVMRCIRSKWVVIVADRVSEAVDLLHKNSFDAILQDLMLPDVSRDDAVSIVHNAAPDTPIIIQSALADRELMQRLVLGEKVINYIVKGDWRSSAAMKQQICLDIERFQVLNAHRKEVAANASE